MPINTGSIFSLVVCAASVLSGCAANPPMSQVARSLQCDPNRIRIDEESAMVRSAHGCGNADVFYVTDESSTSLRERAAYDLACPAGELEIKVIDDRTFGAAGCDRRATYKAVRGQGFVMNNSLSERLTSPK